MLLFNILKVFDYRGSKGTLFILHFCFRPSGLQQNLLYQHKWRLFYRFNQRMENSVLVFVYPVCSDDFCNGYAHNASPVGFDKNKTASIETFCYKQVSFCFKVTYRIGSFQLFPWFHSLVSTGRPNSWHSTIYWSFLRTQFSAQSSIRDIPRAVENWNVPNGVGQCYHENTLVVLSSAALSLQLEFWTPHKSESL